MKIVNVKGIIILVIFLAVIQVGLGLLVSPIIGRSVIESINKRAGTKISAGKVNIWPLTLSCSLEDIKVFDPDNEKKRIVLAQNASLRLSIIGLLSKRLVISSFSMSGAEIDLKGESDGSFNVQKLVKPKSKEEEEKDGALDRLKEKKDWFGIAYDVIKKRYSKKAVEKKAAKRKEDKKIRKEVKALPCGRRIRFMTPSDRYLFQIQNFEIKDSQLKLETDDGKTLNIDKAAINIKNIRLSSSEGICFDKFDVRGSVSKDGKFSGSFNLDYAQSFKQSRQTTICDLSAKDIDVTAIKFIYEGSLPVDLKKGVVSINSHTNIINGSIDSNNSIILKDHTVLPKGGGKQVVGSIPLPIICDALNKTNPVEMKFQITGTVDQPQFKGLQDTLLDLAKPYIAGVTENLKKQGLKAIGELLKKY